MSLETLHNKLGKQYLIASYLESKLQIVNFIKNGYDDNLPVLINNRFLHYTANVYYRSIIVDLYALLGPPNNNNKNSFEHIIKAKPVELKPPILREIRDMLNKASAKVNVIKDLRHTQIAHYDFTLKDSISLNFDELPIINELFHLSQKIIEMLGASFIDDKQTVGYDFGRHDYVDALRRLVARVQ